MKLMQQKEVITSSNKTVQYKIAKLKLTRNAKTKPKLARRQRRLTKVNFEIDCVTKVYYYFESCELINIKFLIIYLFTEPEANIREMVIQPITIKDRQTNTRVLNALNKNHKDDIFLGNKSKKIDTAKVNYTLNKSYFKIAIIIK